MEEREKSWRKQLRRFALEKVAPPEDQGEIYATRFAYVLERLRGRRKIAGWWQTEKYSDDDRQGIDFWVERLDGTVVPFQTTSTQKMAQRRRRKFRKRGEEIPVLFLVKSVGPRKGELKSPKQIEGEVLKVLRSFGSSL